MTIDFQSAKQRLKNFELEELFREMGWDHANLKPIIQINNNDFQLKAIAQKRGFMVFICPPDSASKVPGYVTRRMIETQLRKTVHEHIIIFFNQDHSNHIWQWVRREPGRPTVSREYEHSIIQSGDALLQRLQSLQFSLEEEEKLGGISDVTSRVRATFDVERVTRRFYDRFKDEHTKFMKFLKGIPDEGMQRWYVSVMLNRLMFIYFIQKKLFLDRDENYLRTHLISFKKQYKDRFYGGFLCPLFFEGFAKEEVERDDEYNQLLGKVPYLNGGIFQPHQIEQIYGKQIQIPDASFEGLFDFFDDFRWHLDERLLRDDREINPDVLGYIFEKYINQKDMGAYYTKEDITDYISKSTILPYLLEQMRKDCAIAFEGGNSIWRLLGNDPERYIYTSVQKGCELPLPPEIEAGIKSVVQRGEWNQSAPEAYALPTEIWREVVARRARFEDLLMKMANGQVREINDLITFNLDIQQFTQDVVESCEGPESLRAFWKALNNIRVLDPTCGSGAFLFAALNILEPLYEACLESMQAFVTELDESEKSHRPEKYSDFRQVLDQAKQHPNRRYFILKTIIVNNLYGVDIMDEAVEICKLRLFLKLIAQVDNLNDIEPLPDIDFNVRAGNTLVGFTSIEEVQLALAQENGIPRLLFPEEQTQIDRIKEEADMADCAYRQFQRQQVEKGSVTALDKAALRGRLDRLNSELHQALAKIYGVKTSGPNFDNWLESHKPFHWIVDFYGIMKQGGFGVIIGNPPYVEYNKVYKDYRIVNFQTESCGNLYAFVIERCLSITSGNGFLSTINPMSLVSTQRMQPIIEKCVSKSSNMWSSHYAGDSYPGTLFNGVKAQLCILILKRGVKNIHLFSTKYQRWFQEERDLLFSNLPPYFDVKNLYKNFGIARIGSEIEDNIFNKILEKPHIGLTFDKNSEDLFFRNYSGSYFRLFFDKEPLFIKNNQRQRSSSISTFGIKNKLEKYLYLGLFNSTSFYWYHQKISDAWHVSNSQIYQIGFDSNEVNSEIKTRIRKYSQQFLEKLWENAKMVHYTRRGDTNDYQEFYARRYKYILDEIDKLLSMVYGFNDEELDYLINYDIKYRLGAESDKEEE
jgi:hypothetical protein